MAKHRTTRQWASILQRFENSGLSQAAFCRRHHIPLSTLTYQLRLRRQRERADGEPQPELIELKLPASASGSAMEVSHRGVRIEWRTPVGTPVMIHCASTEVGEILAQIANLCTPSR